MTRPRQGGRHTGKKQRPEVKDAGESGWGEKKMQGSPVPAWHEERGREGDGFQGIK